MFPNIVQRETHSFKESHKLSNIVRVQKGPGIGSRVEVCGKVYNFGLRV